MTGLEKPLWRVEKAKMKTKKQQKKKKKENADIAKEKMSNPLYGQLKILKTLLISHKFSKRKH